MADKTKELEGKFWMALKSDMTMMLGLVGVEESHTRPMTAQLRGSEGPIWFFTARDNTLVQNLHTGSRAIGTFASKDHDLFASVHGQLSLDNDHDVIDELWNPYVAAWYEGGKDDPELALLRFDADRAEIWENESGLFAGLKMLFGHDPKDDAREHVAKVNLR
ncbi:pyridoxamine 5'-phosphate oxidase family protein [Aestuariivirga sp.]|uniref:pyridoxamine 5'-phosphate oxidase family protein n=1 Tax=Aestuariivirga sp. TaxID=2650926 RepID=UPI003BA86735